MKVLHGILLVICLVSASISSSNGYAHPETFNLLDYGAISGGTTDNSQAFLKAWNAACSSETENPTVVVPEEKFLVDPIAFRGPCNANSIKFLILGSILAPTTPSAWEELNPSQWLAFQDINGLNVTSYGRVDGREWMYFTSSNIKFSVMQEQQPEGHSVHQQPSNPSVTDALWQH
ncbi:hypothetical protein TIFTF001_027273 [Ficus carica]|uniref:Polygalacturonase n=1 Tax=Ficus carica TaxID=3494 RepID=A0AA88DNW8_FICCA|nr:hypothetical protein TIFTF001_027273 [Ficus carica]